MTKNPRAGNLIFPRRFLIGRVGRFLRHIALVLLASRGAADTEFGYGRTVKYRSVLGVRVASDVSLGFCDTPFYVIHKIFSGSPVRSPVIVRVLVLEFSIDDLHHIPAQNSDLSPLQVFQRTKKIFPREGNPRKANVAERASFFFFESAICIWNKHQLTSKSLFFKKSLTDLAVGFLDECKIAIVDIVASGNLKHLTDLPIAS
jgi:hypothetical protein